MDNHMPAVKGQIWKALIIAGVQRRTSTPRVKRLEQSSPLGAKPSVLNRRATTSTFATNTSQPDALQGTTVSWRTIIKHKKYFTL